MSGQITEWFDVVSKILLREGTTHKGSPGP